ncbi:MAG: stage II sporulation protein D [Oscillospiraceae bacterium]|nr:stage II sporulation protein D [Oscillospiraceae bacterium]
MKKKFCVYSILCLLLTLMPIIPAMLFSPEISAPENPGISEITENSENTENDISSQILETSEKSSDLQVYHVLDITTNEILEVPVREYLIGAVGAEMPASFEPEALKAQAVAAHTYAERQVLLSTSRSDLQGADFSNDPDQYQAFHTQQQLQKLYGDNFTFYYQKISDAVDAVLPEILCYDDEPIIAAFHAISTGKTESAQNVWGSAITYLQSVDSSSDCDAPSYEQDCSYSAEQIQEMLSAAHSGLLLGTDTANWFGEPVCSDAGTILQIPVGTSIFTGQELRSILRLRSACFTISYDKKSKTFTFRTKGYGHSVGMSQYGANAMALQGSDYREILAHYYPDTVLKTI